MKTLVAFIAGGVLALTLALGALAQDRTPRVNQREKNQKERIKQGVKSGELTKQEAAKLRAEQAKIRADEAKAKADGVVTPRERAKLQREQNRASRDIRKQKHDSQTR